VRRWGLVVLLVLGLAAVVKAPDDLPSGGCWRPYSADSPWNTPIGSSGQADPRSAELVAALDPDNEELTSDPTQFTLPVYSATRATPKTDVTYTDGWFSDVSSETTLTNNRSPDAAERVTPMPVPPGLQPASGGDGQVIVVNQDTGEEWNASSVEKTKDGLRAWNVGRYNVHWSGVPPAAANGTPYWPRGPGIPYLTGLVRPCEIAVGRIEHALAIGVPATSHDFVYPATRSDGQRPVGKGIPEGTRLQLDPSVSDDTIRDDWDCTDECFTVAKAAQRYGVYVADTSGHPKLYFEYEGTAHWKGAITESTVSPIPLSAFRAVRPPRR
jgi:hypothetical protein